MSHVLTEHVIDLRPLPPCEQHLKVSKMWAGLVTGESILLVNDHDPLALYNQFAAEPGTHSWEYLERGPKVFRVRIRKGEFADPGFGPSAQLECSCSAPATESTDSVKPLQLDTRPIFARGETPCHAIDEATSNLVPGQAFVLIVPFEPVPLYAKLGRQGFAHQAKQLDDATWQVEFRRTDDGSPKGPGRPSEIS